MRNIVAATAALSLTFAAGMSAAHASSSFFGSSSWTTSDELSSSSAVETRSITDIFFELVGFDQALKIQSAGQSPFSLSGATETVKQCEDEMEAGTAKKGAGTKKADDKSSTSNVTGPEPLFFAF